jgi:hypothetical protein
LVRVIHPVLLLFGILLVGCASKTPGVIEGTVSGATVEPFGPVKTRIAAIPDVEITIRELSTQAVKVTSTDSNGEFRVEGVNPGRYQVSFVAKPFKRQVQALDVKSDQITDASTRLLTETVDVAGCPTRSVGGFETPDFGSGLIQLKRMGCRGPCPVFSVDVHGDGRVEYKGERYVSSAGSKTYRVNPSDVAALAKQFFGKGFFNLCASYQELAPGQSTAETTMTTIKIDEYGRTVSVYGNAAPQGLEDLNAQIEKIAHVNQSVK